MSVPVNAEIRRAARRLAAAVILAILGVLGGAASAHAWEFDVAGPTVAFRDNADIWLYDLGTRQYRHATATPDDFEQEPAIAGQRVFFSRPGTPDILDAFDLQSALLDQSVAEYDWLTGLSGDAGRLVFAASQSTGFSPQAVYVLDAAGGDALPVRISPTETETLITPTRGDCVRHPDIDYPWVIWTDVDRLDCNQSPGWLYAMNLETQAIQTVARPSCSTCSTEISDGKVALVEPEGSQRVLVTYDLTSGARTVHDTPTEPSYGIKDFRGTRIVYSDDPLSTGPWVYDLASGEVTLVTATGDSEPPYSGTGRLSGDWIVYPTESNARLVAKNLQSGETRVIRPRPSDRDGDGFGDADDQCPDAFGVAPPGCPATEPSTPSPFPAPAGPSTPPRRDFTVRAMGDSVTAAFGYYADGKPVPSYEILGEPIIGTRCRPPKRPDGRCQSPDTVAYPAVWARSIGVRVRYPMFANYAISGATPKQWVDPQGLFRSKFDEVLADDPDVVLLTLGANPFLTDFAFGLFGQWCMRTDWSSLNTRACLQGKLHIAKTEQRLKKLYTELITNTHAVVGVFLYHKAYPKTIPRNKVDILLTALNTKIRSAVAQTKKARPAAARRLRLLTPPSFDTHQCESRKSWVLRTDTCIHPNAAGQRAYAGVITQQLFPGGIR